ncbi:MAG: DUF1080 domain-containing protein [Pirellulaceae bacterium]|nr:DUF1080 domain-containing protein [Pirellulaceae bacterium]
MTRSFRSAAWLTLLSTAQMLAFTFLIYATWSSTSSVNADERPNATAVVSEAVALEEGFQALFDGKTLDQWEGNAEWFRVEDNAIVAGSLKEKIPHNEFLCSKKRYENFELRLEVKLRGEGQNAGVQFRTERIPTKTEVSGYQADVGNAFNRPVWGALYDESRRKKMLAEGPAESVPKWVKTGDWNELKVSAIGARIQIWLNGHPTIDYTEEDSAIARDGIIGLQIHSGPPTEALYRNIRIKVLDK